MNRLLENFRGTALRKSLVLLASFLLLAAFLLIFVLSGVLRDRAVQELAHEDAERTSKMAFEALYLAMSKGSERQKIDDVIARLNSAFPDLKIKAYRSASVAQQFGEMSGEAAIIQSDAALSQALASGQKALLFPDKQNIRYLYPVTAKAECLVCHTQSHIGAVSGVIDITYPIQTLKVSFREVTNTLIAYTLLVLGLVLAGLVAYLKQRETQRRLQIQEEASKALNQAHETLRVSEERFRQINASAHDAIVIIDEQGRFTDWNLAAQQMFQYSPEEVLGQQVHQLIAPPRCHTDAARGLARFQESGEGPLIGKITEISAMRKDGSEFPVELSISAVKLKGHWHAVGVIRDITERKQADRKKYLEEIRLRVSLQLSSMVGADEKVILDFILEEGIRMTDSRYSFIGWMNEDASVMTIHSWSSEVMKTCAVEQSPIKFPIDTAGIWAEPVRNRKAIIINDYAQTHPQKHGYPPGHMEIRRYMGVPVFDGDRVAMIAAVANKNQEYDESDATALSNVMTDAWRVIQRNHAEQEVRESEARYRSLFENMLEGYAYCRMLFEHDTPLDFIYLSVNDAFGKITGLKDVVGKKVSEVIPDIRASNPELFEAYGRVALTGKPETFETYINALGIWFSITAYSTEKEYFIAVFDNITERKQTEQEKLEASIRLKDALEEAIGAIAATLEQRDPYTAGHQRRVAQLAVAIGEEMGLGPEALEGIHFGGLIHDIGKISVPAEILGKPGHITDIELALIKIHAEAGYEIVKNITFPWPVADMVRQHHERLDGSGYPQGLKGEQIILEARILAVADVVEAMLANRPYRAGLGMDTALGEIARARGTQFDPAVVDACLRVIKEKGFVFIK